MMQLTAQLVASLDAARVVGALPPSVDTLETDSRAVRPGSLFVALRGAHVDAHGFVPAALASGAAAVVVERELAVDGPQIIVPDTRAAISRLADVFFEHPSQALRIVGVTGTNGKTTTVHLIEAICAAAGSPCAIVGTLGATFMGRSWPLGNTTPPALELHALLATLRDAGAAAVAMEVSSHALALGRVDDVRFAVAAFTNLTRDHLDFHGSLAEYAGVKRRLLSMAPASAINVDDPVGAGFARRFSPRPDLRDRCPGARARPRRTARSGWQPVSGRRRGGGLAAARPLQRVQRLGGVRGGARLGHSRCHHRACAVHSGRGPRPDGTDRGAGDRGDRRLRAHPGCARKRAARRARIDARQADRRVRLRRRPRRGQARRRWARSPRGGRRA